jgi:hypothetical protein
MGLSVRRYALRLELQNYNTIQRNELMDQEKGFYDDDECSANDYQEPVIVQQPMFREKDSISVIEVAEKPS